MKPQHIVNQLLGEKLHAEPHLTATAFAPTNIALCKYWGKRDECLNLPINSSLSITLPNKGTTTTLTLQNREIDSILLNGQHIDPASTFAKRLITFLDLFRTEKQFHFEVNTTSNIPIAAGLASSASGYAALVLALNQLFHWDLSNKILSILARLGSGSAARSIESGFVKWHVGIEADGMDSFAEQLPYQWPKLRLGLALISEEKKAISSRVAMRETINTSPFYACWPKKAAQDLVLLEDAIAQKDFKQFGETAESNALAMHACMLTAASPICYFEPNTIAMMQTIWRLRKENIPVYFTEDAGPNLKLLFLAEHEPILMKEIPSLDVLAPFKD